MKKLLFVIIIATLLFTALPEKKLKADNSIDLINNLPYAITAVYSSKHLLLIGTENGFFVSTDDGKHFVERDESLGDLHITGIAYTNGKTFLGTGQAGLYISNDLGKTWVSQLSKLNCPTISSISIMNNTIYVTSLCTGFHLSKDFGKTWIDRNNGLPTLRTTAFVEMPTGRCFLGTEEFGLFYSDTLGKTCTWNKFFSPYTITSISYVRSKLIVGTNAGIFMGDIKNANFKKITFIGGSPYILSLIHTQNSIITAVQGFGLFASTDGNNFYGIETGKFSNVNTMFYSSDKFLFIGTKDGNIYKLNLSIPYIISLKKLLIGSIVKGSTYKGNFEVDNIGGGELNGKVESPYFIVFDRSEFGNSNILNFNVDTSTLSEGNYTEVVSVDSNGGDVKVYISFTVEKPSATVIKLVIDSHTASINGKKIYLDASPFIVKNVGRTLVPVRFISEAFGAKVGWDGTERKVAIKMNPTENHPPLLIELWIGKKIVYVNLKKQISDIAPLIIPPGRTMVPLRFVAETLGSEVAWDGKNREITIVYNP